MVDAKNDFDMLTTPHVRPATACDLVALTSLYASFFTEDTIEVEAEKIGLNLRQMFADDRAKIFVIADGETIVGMASCSLTIGVEFGCACELEDLYVVPHKRGLGLSKLLIKHAIDWAKSKSANEIYLVITPEAEVEQNLIGYYEKFGFKNSNRVTMFLNSTD